MQMLSATPLGVQLLQSLSQLVHLALLSAAAATSSTSPQPPIQAAISGISFYTPAANVSGLYNASILAAVGAAATAFAVQAVKNAAQDEAAQRKLEETIKASTNATIAQTKAVANYIDETSIAIGITDDELRPAFARLVRSTND